MEKQHWNDLYNKLDKIYSDAYFANQLYKNGSNKQKRNEGERKMEDAIHLAKYHLDKFPEALELIIDGNPFLYEEFFSLQYFTRDLSTLLSKIKRKLENTQ